MHKSCQDFHPRRFIGLRTYLDSFAMIVILYLETAACGHTSCIVSL